MLMALVVLVISAGLCMFYLQATCDRVVRREFELDYSRALVKVVQLEFLQVRKTIEQEPQPVDYAGLARSLRADFRALTYLLRQTKSPSRKRSAEQCLLRGYFHYQLCSLRLRSLSNLGARAAGLKLSRIIEYFCKELGERLAESGSVRLSPANCVPSI